MCKYNTLTDIGESSILPLPSYLAPYRPNNPDNVCIDLCIVDHIKALWAAKIHTLGCCCGHQGRFGTARLIIATGHSHSDVVGINKILKGIDSRGWIIQQWQRGELKTLSSPT